MRLAVFNSLCFLNSQKIIDPGQTEKSEEYISLFHEIPLYLVQFGLLGKCLSPVFFYFFSLLKIGFQEICRNSDRQLLEIIICSLYQE